MDLPKGKNNPKLPPKPAGGGAAARQKQFELERGLKPACDPEGESPDETKPTAEDERKADDKT